MKIFKRIFCVHSYELKNEFTVKSEYDIIVNSGYKPNSACNTKRKYVSDYTCTKCGKLKRLVIKTANI